MDKNTKYMLIQEYKKIIIFIILWILFVSVYIVYGERFYTPDEVVASVISAEACGEGEIGMYAVANVVANRAKKYNITPYEVVTQKNQFYGYTSENREKLYNQCKEVSDRLTSNIMQLDDITNGALYFRQIGEKKRSWHRVFTIKIGNHLFYK